MRPAPYILVCFTGLFAVFSSTISKSPALPLFAAKLGADPSMVGAVAAVSALTGIIASIPAGILADRFGRRRMLALSGFVFATAPFLYLFVGHIWQLALVRFYHGLATTIFVPVATAYVSGLSAEGRGERIGWFSTSTLLGRFAAPAAGGFMLSAGGPGSGFGPVYILCGVVGLAVLPLVLSLPDDRQSGQPEGPTAAPALAMFFDAVSNKGILVTALVEAAVLFSYGTFETFMPLRIVGYGHSASAAGIILSSQVLTLALTKPFMGRFSDRHGRRPQIMTGALLSAACMAAFSVSTGLPSFFASGVLFGLGMSVVTSATSAHIADLSRASGLGSAMGILGSVMDIGHTAGPLVSGLVSARYGFGPAFMTASAVLILFCAVFFTVPVKKNAAVR